MSRDSRHCTAKFSLWLCRQIIDMAYSLIVAIVSFPKSDFGLVRDDTGSGMCFCSDMTRLSSTASMYCRLIAVGGLPDYLL